MPVVAIALLLVSGCEPADDDTNSVTVGLLLPFTGIDSATANNFERAVLFARDEFNRGGGIEGRKLRVVSADTHSELERGQQSARQLIDAGAVVVIWPESTEVAQQLRPVLDESEILLLSPLEVQATIET